MKNANDVNIHQHKFHVCTHIVDKDTRINLYKMRNMYITYVFYTLHQVKERKNSPNLFFQSKIIHHGQVIQLRAKFVSVLTGALER